MDTSRGLVKDAEGVAVHIAVHADDQQKYDEALAAGVGVVYLRHVPLGIWLRMGKYKSDSFGDCLVRQCSEMSQEHASRLVFVEPRASAAFTFREYTVTRTGFPSRMLV